MQPLISEFSYGFALTNELVGYIPMRAAPIFPSLIEEGKAGGGYDVQLNVPGLPMFIQFKRAEIITRRSGREVRLGANLRVPYYRFDITDPAKSNQHQMLVDLDAENNLVLYAAPRFYDAEGMNHAWLSNNVIESSIFIRPRDIGRVSTGRHTISYDKTSTWLCSEPNEMHSLSGEKMLNQITSQLEKESIPLKERANNLIESLNEIELRLRHGQYDLGIKDETKIVTKVISADVESEQTDNSTSVELRTMKQLEEGQAPLRKAADIAANLLGSQLLIIQKLNQ